MPGIYIAGHRGMVGSALMRTAQRRNYENIITRTHKELDLLNPLAVEEFFESEKPDLVEYMPTTPIVLISFWKT